MERLTHRWAAELHVRLSGGNGFGGGVRRRSLRALTAALVTTVISAACGDLPTEGATEIPAATLSKTTADVGTVDVLCTTSQATPGGAYPYEYGRLNLKLPASTRVEDGSTRLVRYRFYAGQQVVRAANCTVPNSKKALEKINHLFRVTLPRQMEVQDEGMAQIMTTGDEPVMLEPIDAKACQYGDPAAYPDCSKQGELPEEPVDHQVCSWWTGCGGYTGGGGGDDPDPDGPDPCMTGDGIIDSKALAPGLDQIWKASNADAPNVLDRVEKGGWIVRTANGYEVRPWTQVDSNYCQGNGVEPWPPEGPGAIVGFVHSHPYSFGETIPTCEGPTTPYFGMPSVTDDMETSLELGQKLGMPGGLPGYIIDKSGISRFTGEKYSSTTDRFDRCAY